MTALNSIKLFWQGLRPYSLVLQCQNDIHKDVLAGEAPVVLGCEHPLVITFGKRSNNFDDLLIPLSTLRAQNIEIFTVDRGGHATLHNPGQLVLYPVIPIKKLGIGVREYVDLLEMTTALLLAEHGLDVGRSQEPGLWINNKKIAAFGIRVDRGVTTHGLAINVSNELNPFRHIKQCGISSDATNMEQEMATFMEAKPSLSIENMARRWVEIFSGHILSKIDMAKSSNDNLPQLEIPSSL